MSDELTHECGIAAVRLRKPLEYYYDRYGTALWGFNKLFLLMEKQHNRGQDGIGIGCVKLGMDLGQPYIFRRCPMRISPPNSNLDFTESGSSGSRMPLRASLLKFLSSLRKTDAIESRAASRLRKMYGCPRSMPSFTQPIPMPS